MTNGLIRETYTLSNGMTIPKIGFGCYNPKGGDTYGMIRRAIDAGYTYFDTASLYETERALGQAVRDSKVPREDLLIASKAWHDEMGAENVREAFFRSLKRLQLDYIDLFLIHWPRPNAQCDWKKLDLETWNELEKLKDQGFIKALGVSNFLPHHLENLLDHSDTKPVVDQMELHPGYLQEAAVRFCQEHKILPQAWGPIGRGRIFQNSVVNDLSAKYGKSFAQICLRFLLQRGIQPMPKAMSEEHMRENADVFDFEISREDMWLMSCMPQTDWLGEHPDLAIPQKASNPDQ